MQEWSKSWPPVSDEELIAMGALIDDDAPAGGERRKEAAPRGAHTSGSMRRRAAWIG